MSGNYYLKSVSNILVKNCARHLNSKSWLQRRSKDKYVELAKTTNYRCRSAFKLIEIDNKYKIIKQGAKAVDLGAAPGSWTQVLVRRSNADGQDVIKPKGMVIAIDRLPIYPIEHATIVSKLDFTLKSSREHVLQMLGNNKLDLVVSDMAPNATGVRSLDQEAIANLAMEAVKFAINTSVTGATCLVKIWDGGFRKNLENELLRFYSQLHHIRPQATQTESTELFLLARGFKGNISS